FYFFFQAEDGIRDRNVTGVQTCALPISTWLLVSAHGWRLLAEECGLKDEAALQKATGGDWTSVRSFNDADRGAEPASGSVQTLEIGRASCRERVWSGGVDVAVKEESCS